MRPATMPRLRWWETNRFAAAAILCSAIPLLWPALPPLADLPGHIGRYHVAANLARSPDLARHWSFDWALVGNLGVDLLVHLLSPVLDAERAAKLVVVLIPPLWVSGLILLSRSGGRRLSPAAAFAFPLAYGFPFQFGFVNFMLSAALALHALALWIRLGDAGRLRLRAALFVPIGCALWIAHSFGWGLFGLIAFGAELARHRRAGGAWPASVVRSALHCAVLALPLAWMIATARTGGPPPAWDWQAKASWVASLLRERWKWYDVASAIVVLAVVWAGVRDRRLAHDPAMAAAALLCFAAFLALPRLLLGGAYVDMRMLAPAAALALAGLRVDPGHPRLEAALALAATAFFALRTATSTIAMLLFATTQQSALEAVQHLPRGATVLVLVREPCASQWSSNRLGHIAGLAVARRDVFENGQWALDGQQLMRPRHPGAAPYRADPSQLVYPATCEFVTTDFDRAIATFDRATFSHIWTLDFAARPALAGDVRLIWANRTSAVYRIDPDRLQPRPVLP